MDPLKFIGSPEHQLFEDAARMATYIETCVQQKRKLSPIIWGVHFSLDRKYRMPCLTRYMQDVKKKIKLEYQFIADESVIEGRFLDKLGVDNTCGKISPSFIKRYAPLKDMMTKISWIQMVKRKALEKEQVFKKDADPEDTYNFQPPDEQFKWMPNPSFKFLRTHMNVYHKDFASCMERRRPLKETNTHALQFPETMDLEELLNDTVQKFKMVNFLQRDASPDRGGMIAPTTGTNKTQSTIGTNKTESTIGTNETDRSTGSNKTEFTIGTYKTGPTTGNSKTAPHTMTKKTVANVIINKTALTVANNASKDISANVNGAGGYSNTVDSNATADVHNDTSGDSRDEHTRKEMRTPLLSGRKHKHCDEPMSSSGKMSKVITPGTKRKNRLDKFGKLQVRSLKKRSLADRINILRHNVTKHAAPDASKALSSMPQTRRSLKELGEQIAHSEFFLEPKGEREVDQNNNELMGEMTFADGTAIDRTGNVVKSKRGNNKKRILFSQTSDSSPPTTNGKTNAKKMKQEQEKQKLNETGGETSSECLMSIQLDDIMDVSQDTKGLHENIPDTTGLHEINQVTTSLHEIFQQITLDSTVLHESSQDSTGLHEIIQYTTGLHEIIQDTTDILEITQDIKGHDETSQDTTVLQQITLDSTVLHESSQDSTGLHEIIQNTTGLHEIIQDTTDILEITQDIKGHDETSQDTTVLQQITLDSTGLYESSQDSTGLHEIIQNTTGLHEITQDTTDILEITQDIKGHDETSQDTTVLQQITLDSTGLHEIIQNTTGLHEITQDTTDILEITQDIKGHDETTQDTTVLQQITLDSTGLHESSQDKTGLNEIIYHERLENKGVKQNYEKTAWIEQDSSSEIDEVLNSDFKVAKEKSKIDGKTVRVKTLVIPSHDHPGTLNNYGLEVEPEEQDINMAPSKDFNRTGIDITEELSASDSMNYVEDSFKHLWSKKAPPVISYDKKEKSPDLFFTKEDTVKNRATEMPTNVYGNFGLEVEPEEQAINMVPSKDFNRTGIDITEELSASDNMSYVENSFKHLWSKKTPPVISYDKKEKSPDLFFAKEDIVNNRVTRKRRAPKKSIETLEISRETTGYIPAVPNEQSQPKTLPNKHAQTKPKPNEQSQIGCIEEIIESMKVGGYENNQHIQKQPLTKKQSQEMLLKLYYTLETSMDESEASNSSQASRENRAVRSMLNKINSKKLSDHMIFDYETEDADIYEKSRLVDKNANSLIIEKTANPSKIPSFKTKSDTFHADSLDVETVSSDKSRISQMGKYQGLIYEHYKDLFEENVQIPGSSKTPLTSDVRDPLNQTPREPVTFAENVSEILHKTNIMTPQERDMMFKQIAEIVPKKLPEDVEQPYSEKSKSSGEEMHCGQTISSEASASRELPNKLNTQKFQPIPFDSLEEMPQPNPRHPDSEILNELIALCESLNADKDEKSVKLDFPLKHSQSEKSLAHSKSKMNWVTSEIERLLEQEKNSSTSDSDEDIRKFLTVEEYANNNDTTDSSTINDETKRDHTTFLESSNESFDFPNRTLYASTKLESSSLSENASKQQNTPSSTAAFPTSGLPSQTPNFQRSFGLGIRLRKIRYSDESDSSQSQPRIMTRQQVKEKTRKDKPDRGQQ